MKAIDVFSEAIKYLMEHIMKAVNQRNKAMEKVTLKNIRWVLTVPAIWSYSAKRFMREAAEKV